MKINSLINKVLNDKKPGQGPGQSAGQGEKRAGQGAGQEAVLSQALDIEPMTTCLHGKICPELYSRRGDRPGCFVNMERIFDLERCPANKWEKFD